MASEGVPMVLGRATYVILGAGPTGTTIGSLLARGGADVLLLDQAPVPAGVVGESLIPMIADVIRELGLNMDGFLVKRGAVFTRGDQEVRFSFDHALRDSPPYAWQVPRAEFDAHAEHGGGRGMPHPPCPGDRRGPSWHRPHRSGRRRLSDLH